VEHKESIVNHGPSVQKTAMKRTLQQLDIDSKTAPVVNKSIETSNDDKEDSNLKDWEADLNLDWKPLSDQQRETAKSGTAVVDQIQGQSAACQENRSYQEKVPIPLDS
jgi:hypothetical protein